MKKILYILFFAGILYACSSDSIVNEIQIDSYDAKVQSKQSSSQFGVPEISQPELLDSDIHLEFTPGENGATGGFVVRWMTEKSYNDNGWNDDLACHAQFTANRNNDYGKEEGETFHFYLAEALLKFDEEDTSECSRDLKCGLTYFFKVQAHTDGQIKKSEFSEAVAFSTAACDEICPFGKGYWKNHSDINPSTNQDDAWPEAYKDYMSLGVGQDPYSRAQLNDIFDMSNNQGNGLIILAQHLIAAKLNLAIGASMEGIEETIMNADILIGENVIGEDIFSNTEKADSEVLKNILEEFNEQCAENED